MKVVIAGASGSGKTTLAKALAAHFGWEFKENSAGMIISHEDKNSLKMAFGYEGGWGQQRVINYSNWYSHFGMEFQVSILRARRILIETEGDHVYDRSALDPIVFYLNQVAHNHKQDVSRAFIHECIKGLRNVDLILRIPLQNPNREIEDNLSRVNNWYFQKKVDDMFDTAMDVVMHENRENPILLGGKVISVSKCPTWDWDARLEWAIQQVYILTPGRI